MNFNGEKCVSFAIIVSIIYISLITAFPQTDKRHHEAIFEEMTNLSYTDMSSIAEENSKTIFSQQLHKFIDFGDKPDYNIEPKLIRTKRNLIEIENPEEVLNVLESLSQSIANNEYDLYKNQKRGIDLGLSRGFSGSQAAKHLMGMSAASFANGPGRRRK